MTEISRRGVLPNVGYKSPVKVVTNGPIVLFGPQTVNSVPVSVPDRVCVNNQTNPAENGLYNVGAGAWVRTADFDDRNDVVPSVQLLDENTGFIYRASFVSPFIPDTTDINFTQASLTNVSWSEILGTLSDQTDLQAALDLKAPLANPVFTGSFTSPGIDDNATSVALTLADTEYAFSLGARLVAGDEVATTGASVIEGHYSGLNRSMILGSLRGSSATALMHNVRPDPVTTDGFESANAISTNQQAFTMDSNGFHFYNAVVSTPAIGTDVTMTERFAVLAGGDIAINPTKRIYLDSVLGNGNTYIYESTTDTVDIVCFNSLSLRVEQNQVTMGSYVFDTDQTVGVGQDDYVMKYDHSAGQIKLEATANTDVVTNHIRAGNTQLIDGAVVDSSFEAVAVITANTFETIGPTGSGATNIWTEMDQLPSNATILICDLGIFFNSNSTAFCRVNAYAAQGDVTPAALDGRNEIGVAAFHSTVVGHSARISQRVEIPLGPTNQDFKFGWRNNLGGAVTGEEIRLFYRGFKTD